MNQHTSRVPSTCLGSAFLLFEARDSGFSLFEARDSGFSLFETRDSGVSFFETRDLRLNKCAGGGMPKITLRITGVPEILGRDHGIEERYWGPSNLRAFNYAFYLTIT